LSPRIRVVWPTSTPATSVIAFQGPVGRVPVTMPRSRARGRVWPAAKPIVMHREQHSAARMGSLYHLTGGRRPLGGRVKIRPWPIRKESQKAEEHEMKWGVARHSPTSGYPVHRDVVFHVSK
jgi:hypothetical protein